MVILYMCIYYVQVYITFNNKRNISHNYIQLITKLKDILFNIKSIYFIIFPKTFLPEHFHYSRKHVFSKRADMFLGEIIFFCYRYISERI